MFDSFDHFFRDPPKTMTLKEFNECFKDQLEFNPDGTVERAEKEKIALNIKEQIKRQVLNQEALDQHGGNPLYGWLIQIAESYKIRIEGNRWVIENNHKLSKNIRYTDKLEVVVNHQGFLN